MAPAKKRVRADTQVGPYRSSSSLHPIQKNGRGQRPVPTGLSWCQASGRCRHRPLRKGGAAATTLASGAQRSVCAAVTRDGWRVRQRSPPKVSSNLGQSLSRLTATAPFAQGSLVLRGHRNSPAMPVRDLPSHRHPRLLQGRELRMTAGTPPRASVPRPNVPRKRAAKRPRPFPEKSP